METGESLVPRPAVCWLNSELYGVAVTGRGPALRGTLQLQVLQLLENYAIFVHAYGFSAGREHSTRRPSFSGRLPPKDCPVPYASVGCYSTEGKKGTGIRSRFSRI